MTVTHQAVTSRNYRAGFVPKRIAGTFQAASATIARLIFDVAGLALAERDRHLDHARTRP